ncbi:MAG: hypothetical protein IJ646_13695 [Clostridia bacterium]|nr:hypothetical protein [Clostridia bacterium]
MIDPNCCFIRAEYFEAHPDFKKMLDIGDTAKQSRRTYVYVRVEFDGNDFYLPLRNNLGRDVRPYGRIGHAVPSQKRPNAGLDYRYALIVNDGGFIEPHTSQKLPDSQYRIISDDYDAIKQEFLEYLRKYKKAALKHRVQREPLFRESCLINFDDEILHARG